MSYHIDNGLEYEIDDNNTNATLLGFANNSLAINNIPNMEIPDFVRGVPVTSIAANAFEKVDELESVTIPSTLTQIGTCAFLGCQHLTKVRMSTPLAKKDALRIQPSAFAYCFSLDEVDIFCMLELEARAFFACDKLTKISGTITYLEESVFRDCNRIYMLNLQHNATVKFDAFYGSTIENIRCLGDVIFSENDIRELISNNTTLYCYSDSKTAELAYCGVAISCKSRT